MTFCFEDISGIDIGLPCEDIFNSVASHVLETEGCPFEAEINLTLVDRERIREMNREFRGIDAVTDVLSFPMVELIPPGDFSGIKEDSPEYFDPDSGEIILGDIVICSERAMEQAEEYGHSVKREFAFLIAHSMLHLLGFDHEDKEEERIMLEKQERALSFLGILR